MTYLPDDLYNTITQSIPIACVDIIPVRQGGGERGVGAIIRATGPEKGKLALIGGRIWHNESIPSAIKRHLSDSIGVEKFTLIPSNSIDRPFRVQQYFHTASNQSPESFDPTKHAVALTYLVEISGDISPQGEASEFQWLKRSSVPSNSAYNQHVVLEEAFSFLQ